MLSIRKKNVVHLNNYNPDDENQVVITFDDGYKEIIKYALPVLKYFNYPFEIFLVGNFLEEAEKGNNNYLDKNDLEKIRQNGGRLQYHSKTHPHLETISDSTILEDEIKTPDMLKMLDPEGFTWFAYPFWTYNNDVIAIVRKYYHGARSGNGHANGTVYAMDSKRQ
ncbi:hypothetical protein AGMMS50293_26250 [Spirochaetia bacterium]|nr:hypothetical protein AGMMS50293_26250 [Spirochaetia bacterium]